MENNKYQNSLDLFEKIYFKDGVLNKKGYNEYKEGYNEYKEEYVDKKEYVSTCIANGKCWKSMIVGKSVFTPRIAKKRI